MKLMIFGGSEERAQLMEMDSPLERTEAPIVHAVIFAGPQEQLEDLQAKYPETYMVRNGKPELIGKPTEWVEVKKYAWID